MKVVHVIKKVETIDNDIKELRKLEKSLAKDKSFSTPIYMTIEKQINILLGERIKLLDLRITDPPESLVSEIEGEPEEISEEALPSIPEPKKTAAKKSKPKSPAAKEKAASKPAVDIFDDNDEIPMLTQDQIDARFDSLKSSPARKEEQTAKPVKSGMTDDDHAEEENIADDNSIKLLDVALEKGTLNRKVIEKDKKVKFFRENFPSD